MKPSRHASINFPVRLVIFRRNGFFRGVQTNDDENGEGVGPRKEHRIKFNKLTSVFRASVLLLIMNFVITLSL